MGDGRHRRRDGREDDLTTTALRRLQEAGVRPGGGWVPSSPPSAATQDELPSPDEQQGSMIPRRPTGRSLRHGRGLVDRLPTALRAATVAPAARAVAGLVLLVVLAVIAASVATWLSRPREEPLPDRGPSVGAPAGTTAGTPVHAEAPLDGGGAGLPASDPSPTGTVWVHVAGAVRRPGVVELVAGSRVADALEAAGGPRRSAQTASVNLARRVVDGEQVVVLRRGGGTGSPAPTGPGGTAVGGSAPGAGGAPVPGTPSVGPVDLNTATLLQLDVLPGIGPVLAQRILDWRTRNGRFSAVDELGEVSGIGEATLADLRPVVTV